VTLPGASYFFLWPVLACTAALGVLIWRGREPGATWAQFEAMTVDRGAELLAELFSVVERHDLAGELLIPGPQPVIDYVASTWTAQSLPDPEAFTAAVTERVQFGPDGMFRVRTRSGVLICR